MNQSISIPEELNKRLVQLVQLNGGEVSEMVVDLLKSGLDEKSADKYVKSSWDQLSPLALVSPEQASQRLLLSQSKLAKLRCTGKGPRFVKLGSRTVAYRVKDIDSFIHSNLQTSTSESH